VDNELYKALKTKYKAVIREQEYNVKVWLKTPTLIPEHMNIIEEIDSAVAKIADYEERLMTLEKLHDETSPDLYH
jgi:hypothetical protein